MRWTEPISTAVTKLFRKKDNHNILVIRKTFHRGEIVDLESSFNAYEKNQIKVSLLDGSEIIFYFDHNEDSKMRKVYEELMK